MDRAIDSPSPPPGALAGKLTDRSKIWLSDSLGMPGPVSCTSIRANPSPLCLVLTRISFDPPVPLEC